MKESIIYKNINLSYTRYGKGYPIILLHGFLEDSTMWNKLVPRLKNQNQIITIDLLGHGNTDCLGYVHSMEEMANAVKYILNHLKIKKCYLIGHSMGGYVSLAFIEKFKEIVKGICLINSTSQSDTEERKKNRIRATELAKKNYPALANMSVSNLFTNESRIKFSKELENCKNIALKTSVQSYIACSEGMRIRKNRESILKNYNLKKLIITGKKDSILNYNSIQEEAKRTKTQLISFSNGHMSYIENAKELETTIFNFIEN